ncbi:unnamed protein product [Phaedon cochleariae]|uniref:Angiogenic factor with G patch and FHA domains 1 n=1 Tax=Phaedon cochleariae TaxID=80249 RepID=A0A9P0DKC0_PHACE|nr:unnamed protein product [Phaedon cochleariae]
MATETSSENVIKNDNEINETDESEDHTLSDKEKNHKNELCPDLKEKLLGIPGALEYIQKLEKLILKQVKKIKKLRNKLKNAKGKDVFTQTDFEDKALPEEENVETHSEPKTLADDIKQAAELAMQNTGFVYEETSGMYYDYNTGYYYNAEYGLYYDGTTGTYMKYNQETQSYEFHSQVSTESQEQEKKLKKQVQKRKKKNGHSNKEVKRTRADSTDLQTQDVEEGECSDSLDSSSEDGVHSDSSDISKQWPPCMRVIIESSDVPKLKRGSLHIITFSGGTVGREGAHSILVPDINVSKHHLKITFDKESSQYLVVDLGSRNGTLLNGKRISSSKQESDPVAVTHGSKIQIGSTIFLCHVHEGNQTCGHCEPGLIQSKEEEIQKVDNTTRTDRYRKELKNLRMMYGVAHAEDDTKLAKGYTDRAQKRRETIGSQNPHEKTQTASIDESINKENKGFKMLEKMGWKQGESLGKDGEGLLEPVKLVSNEGKSGVGSTESVVQSFVPNERQEIWKKTQERFQKLPATQDSFDVDLED